MAASWRPPAAVSTGRGEVGQLGGVVGGEFFFGGAVDEGVPLAAGGVDRPAETAFVLEARIPVGVRDLALRGSRRRAITWLAGSVTEERLARDQACPAVGADDVVPADGATAHRADRFGGPAPGIG